MGFMEITVKGFAEYDVVAHEQEKQRGRGHVFVFFIGNKDQRSGQSFCPNCVQADGVVRPLLQNLPDGSVFINCQVGDHSGWLDPENEFRKKVPLTGIPTLLRYGTPQKLVEKECFNADLVKMLLSER